MSGILVNFVLGTVLYSICSMEDTSDSSLPNVGGHTKIFAHVRDADNCAGIAARLTLQHN